jgi:hypothetical protein
MLEKGRRKPAFLRHFDHFPATFVHLSFRGKGALLEPDRPKARLVAQGPLGTSGLAVRLCAKSIFLGATAGKNGFPLLPIAPWG